MIRTSQPNRSVAAGVPDDLVVDLDWDRASHSSRQAACSVDWFVSLLVREEVLLTDLCERKILF